MKFLSLIFFYLFCSILILNSSIYAKDLKKGTDEALKMSASGILVQKMQLRVSAENIANASTIRTANGLPYQKKYLILNASDAGVRVAAIKKSKAPFKQVYDPANPLADEKGFIYLPNVDVSSEMVQISLTSVLYDANATAYKSAKAMYQQSLDLLK